MYFAITSLGILYLSLTNANEVAEPDAYCLGESFNATCTHGVIVMTSALYGRMRLGKCVTMDMGQLGCAVDVLAIADGICSGRQACEIRVANTQMDTVLTCLKEFSRYLKASYYCQPVYIPLNQPCENAQPLSVLKQGVHLSSSASTQSNCGFTHSPFILEAMPGQQLQVSLLDFSWNATLARGILCSRTYGHLVDLETDEMIRICGNNTRKRDIYISRGHRIQLVFDKAAVKQFSFIVQFNAVGCPDLVEPHNSLLIRDSNTTTVTCHGARQTWYLKCIDNHWEGVIGNCSQHAVLMNSKAVTSELFAFPNEIYIVLIVVASGLISFTIIFIGFICMKRNSMKPTHEYIHSQVTDQQLYSSIELATDLQYREQVYKHNIPVGGVPHKPPKPPSVELEGLFPPVGNSANQNCRGDTAWIVQTRPDRLEDGRGASSVQNRLLGH